MTDYIFTIVSPTGRSRSSYWGEQHAAKPDAYSLARASDEYSPAYAWPTGLLAGSGAITRTDSKWNAGIAGEPPHSSGYPSGGFQWFHVGNHARFTKIGVSNYDPATNTVPSGTSRGPLQRALNSAKGNGSGYVNPDPNGVDGGLGFTSGPVCLIGTIAGATRRHGAAVICEAVTLWWSSMLDPVSGSVIGVPSIANTIANTRTWLAANP